MMVLMMMMVMMILFLREWKARMSPLRNSSLTSLLFPDDTMTMIVMMLMLMMMVQSSRVLNWT